MAAVLKARAPLRDFRFRANPAYELVPLDCLTEAELQVFQNLHNDRASYSVLRPRNDPRLTFKSVTGDVAQLLLKLQDAAPLPQDAVDALGDRCDSFVLKMVFDEILQVEVKGEMFCGASAMQILDPMGGSVESQGVLAALSRRALLYAEELKEISVPELSLRLYSYNRVPASPRWRRLLPDRAAVRSHLGLDDNALRRSLDAAWSEVPMRGGWMAWQSTRVVSSISGTTHKLYVSPACTAISSTIGASIEAASRFRSFYFKAGGDLAGLLRPDKLILYFERFSDLQRSAAFLMQRLSGCPSHGVPFTAELEPRGLLSWGLDPPHDKLSAPWLERESWRARICNRLALALTLVQKPLDDGISRSHLALQRLRLEGIDTDKWTPAALI